MQRVSEASAVTTKLMPEVSAGAVKVRVSLPVPVKPVTVTPEGSSEVSSV